MRLKIPFFRQDTDHTCGPASLQMVLSFLGDRKSEKYIAKVAHTTKDGTQHHGLIHTALKEGFYCYANNHSSIDELKHFVGLGLPVIVHYTKPSDDEGHYSVVVGVGQKTITLHDPWNGPNFKLSLNKFLSRWRAVGEHKTHNKWLMVLSSKNFNIGRQYVPLSTVYYEQE